MTATVVGLIALASALLGAGTVLGVQVARQDRLSAADVAEVVDASVAPLLAREQVAAQLTSIDVSAQVCADSASDQTPCLLVLCWQMTAGTEASGAECDRLSNLYISDRVREACGDDEDCRGLYRERK